MGNNGQPDEFCNNLNSNKPKITLRPPKAGEWGWIMQKHGEVYAKEYSFSDGFERIVGEIICNFMKNMNHLPRCKVWIGDVDGKPMGSIFCSQETETIAKLRLMFVSPEARGFGLGTKLLDTCIQFARDAGYKKIILWTHAAFVDARRVYNKAGFKLDESKTSFHFMFGPEQEGQVLELDL